MKFSVTRNVLIKPVQAITGIVDKRNTMAILGNIKLEAHDGVLSLAATDLEVEVIAKIPVAVEVPGSITVPGKKLLDICRSLPDEASLAFTVDGSQAVLTSGRSRFTLAVLSADDFPSIESKLEDAPVQVVQSVLSRLLKRSYFAMASQDVRYFLNGLLVEMSDTYLRTVATNGHRLAMTTSNMAIPLSGAKRQVIVPRKAVMELMRLLDDSDEVVDVTLGAGHIRVTLPHYQFTSKLIDGRYPDYNRVIPTENKNIVKVNRELLKQTLSRTAILSNEKYHGIRVNMASNLMTLSANNPEQEEAKDELDVEYTGAEMEIGFNVNYLIDALSVMEQEHVVIVLNGASGSAVLRDGPDSDSVYVVMPIRL